MCNNALWLLRERKLNVWMNNSNVTHLRLPGLQACLFSAKAIHWIKDKVMDRCIAVCFPFCSSEKWPGTDMVCIQSHQLQGAGILDHVLIFLLNENICNNSNWVSITVQSISLSVSVSILPRASPTSVSVKLLTPCQLWRRAYLDPGDGWVLVDLSHANIFPESAERGAVCVCVCLSPSLNPHMHVNPQLCPRTQAESCVLPITYLTPGVSRLNPDGCSTDPTVSNKWEDLHFFFQNMVNLTHVLYQHVFFCFLAARAWSFVPSTNQQN